jgi:hypothetical protein
MVRVPCLWDEWQWVSLSQTAPSGIPGDLPEVIQPYQVWGLYLADLIFPLCSWDQNGAHKCKIRAKGELSSLGLR